MAIKIYLKSGATIPVKCDHFTVETNVVGAMTGYEITGITENNPFYLNVNDVSAIVRVFSDEKPEISDDEISQEDKNHVR